jgi:twitching motility protein PilT
VPIRLVAMDAEPFSIDDLLSRATEAKASDLHLVPGAAPIIRVHGELVPLEGAGKLSGEETRALLYRILSTELQKQLEIGRQLDFSYGVPGLARFRVNVHFQRGTIAAAFRHIPEELRTLEELGLPPSLRDLAMMPRGLVLVTGPTGSGKSTTLASMIDEINRTKPHHILTIEDPIEFVHRHKRCVVTQREIGADAESFGQALRAALRQDPDVILLGEMRDLETIATALTAAETGHLVLATLHTQSAPSTIDRVIDVFPPAQQEQVRMQLANTLQGVVTQTLLPTADGQGRVACLEILFPDDAVRNMIRQGKIEQIYSVMQTSTQRGMQTMEHGLAELIRRGTVTPEAALAVSSRKDQLVGMLERSGVIVTQAAPDAGASGGALRLAGSG